MPVAPSFKDMPVVKPAYEKNGKMYVDVKNLKTGTVRSVRLYTDSEYAKSYGKKLSKSNDDGWDNLKEVRGFSNGPILVIRKNKPSDEEWLRRSVARYAMGVGWYITSTDELPSDAPANFQYLLFSWDEFKGVDDRHAKQPSELSAILDKKIRNKEWVNING